MRFVRTLLIFSGLGVIGYAIYNYYAKQVDIIKNIQYDIVGVQIADFSLNRISLNITSRIYNASNVSATIKSIYLDVFLDGVNVGNINEIKDIVIQPLATNDVTVQLAFNPEIVVANVIGILGNAATAKDVMIDMKGYVTAESSFITTTIPFDYHNTLKTLMNKK
jgi:LEA14-like dessication related protein